MRLTFFHTIFAGLCLSALVLLFPRAGKAAEDLSEEQKIKVALVYKLGKFVYWPDSPLQQQNKVFTICVLGNDPLNPAFMILENRKIGVLPIKIEYVEQSIDIDNGCRIAFITESKRAFLKNILQRLDNRPVLTISDSHGFAESGGIIELRQEASRIGFTINLNSARRAGLEIAAPLLELSTVIEEQGK